MTDTFTYIGIAAVFITFGALILVVWQYLRREHVSSTRRNLNLILGIFFTFIALVATTELVVLTFRFDNYVDTTVNRDLAQEQCAQDTLKTLKHWEFARRQAEAFDRKRDETLFPIFKELQEGRQPGPDLALAVENALHDTEIARKNLERAFIEAPLPNCHLMGE